MSDARPAVTGYLRWLGRFVVFAGYFGWELARANATIAWEIITPGTALAPGIVEKPLHCRTDLEIATMANLITLTPGTLTVAIQRDPPTLYVHGSHAVDPHTFRAHLDDFEARMLDALRFEGRPSGAPPPRAAGEDRPGDGGVR